MRALGLLVPLVMLACSSENPANPPSDAGTDAACVRFDAGPAATIPDAGEEDAPPPAPTVSRAEIDDIIKNSCSFSSCHGRAPGQGKLYLPAPPNNWVVEVVNKASTEHKTMKRVVPGDPSNSFLVHKLTDDLCALTSECVDGNCGVRMPESSDPLPKQDVDKIITWIREGASEK